MSDNRKLSRPAAPPLPATRDELLSQRRVLSNRTLNDDVDEAHVELWEDPDYQRYFLPIWREETIEGSFISDEDEAARMLREHGKKNNLELLAAANLTSIRRSLRVVCRRLRISRSERQNSVRGENVPYGREDRDDNE